MIIRTVENIMRQYDCDEETAQRYIDLRDEGHQQYQALVMAGLRDPWEERYPANQGVSSFLGSVAKRKPCTLGMGCDEAGVCYADAHNEPSQCGRL